MVFDCFVQCDCRWLLFYLMFLFFFKQKTAYEMRISDWSSDVCSSDLGELLPGFVRARRSSLTWLSTQPRRLEQCLRACVEALATLGDVIRHLLAELDPELIERVDLPHHCIGKGAMRSEEHTSELQSLMRISYAVFCLNTK